MSKQEPYQPRRRYQRPKMIWPFWLKLTAFALVFLLVNIVVSIAIGQQTAKDTVARAAAAKPEVEYRVWERPIPVASQECLDMLEKADSLYDKSVTNEQQLLKFMKLVLDGTKTMKPDKLIEAGKTIEQAQKLTPQMAKVRRQFIAQYGRCKA